MATDYYDLLGRDAATPRADEIKRAYRRLARELHPDANPGDPAAEAAVQGGVALAYEVLSDPEKRQRYDRFGADGVAAAATRSAAAGVGDIFDAFFGGGSPFGGRRPPGPDRPAPGRRPRGGRRPRLRGGGVRRPARRSTCAPPSPATTCEATGAAPGTAAASPAPSAPAPARCAGSASRSSARWSPLGPVPRCNGHGPGHHRALRRAARARAARSRSAPTPSTSPPASTPAPRCASPGAGAVGPRGGAGRRPLRPRAGAAARALHAATATTCHCDLPVLVRPGRARRATSTSRPSTAPRTSSIPPGTQHGQACSGCGAAACPHLERPRSRRPDRARRRRRPHRPHRGAGGPAARSSPTLRGEDGRARRRRASCPASAPPSGRHRGRAARRSTPARSCSSPTSTHRELRDDDRHHLERVLRLRAGDPLVLADGAGRWRPARFGATVEPDRRRCERAAAPEPADHAWRSPSVKGDKPELVVQKLTELGVDRIVPFRAERSVVRWDDDQGRPRRPSGCAASPARRRCSATARGCPRSTDVADARRRCRPAAGRAGRSRRAPAEPRRTGWCWSGPRAVGRPRSARPPPTRAYRG